MRRRLNRWLECWNIHVVNIVVVLCCICTKLRILRSLLLKILYRFLCLKRLHWHLRSRLLCTTTFLLLLNFALILFNFQIKVCLSLSLKLIPLKILRRCERLRRWLLKEHFSVIVLLISSKWLHWCRIKVIILIKLVLRLWCLFKRSFLKMFFILIRLKLWSLLNWCLNRRDILVLIKLRRISKWLLRRTLLLLKKWLLSIWCLWRHTKLRRRCFWTRCHLRWNHPLLHLLLRPWWLLLLLRWNKLLTRRLELLILPALRLLWRHLELVVIALNLIWLSVLTLLRIIRWLCW